MLGLSFVWIVAGVALGALANGARLGLRARGFTGGRATLATLGIGAGAGLLFGWLGVWLFGRPFGTPMALWGAALSAVLVPWALQRRLLAVRRGGGPAGTPGGAPSADSAIRQP